MQMNTPAAFEPGVAMPPHASPEALCFVWREDRILVRATEPPTLPTLGDANRLGLDGSRFFLGRLEGVDCFALRIIGEAPESIEDCINREVLEEVGVKVDNLRYFASQSWPFPQSLMIAFTAEYVSGDMRPCDDEIVDAKWFTLDALPQLPGPVSISRQ